MGLIIEDNLISSILQEKESIIINRNNPCMKDNGR